MVWGIRNRLIWFSVDVCLVCFVGKVGRNTVKYFYSKTSPVIEQLKCHSSNEGFEITRLNDGLS